MFKDDDKANKLGTDFKNLKDKIYTAKVFLLLHHSSTLCFFLFAEFCSTSSRIEAASCTPAGILFFFIPYRANKSILASYSHVPYLKHNIICTCASVMLHFVGVIPMYRDLGDGRLTQS